MNHETRKMSGGSTGQALERHSEVSRQHRRTLTLPDQPGGGPMAVNLLKSVIEAPDLVTMLVLGGDERAGQIVGWARKLCAGTDRSGGCSPRRVVWVRGPELPEVKVFLALLLSLPLPRVAVVRGPDEVRVRLTEEEVEPGCLERAFLAGEEV